ncbi:MAG: putative dienelactone hydrolase [Pseudomonadales bacterium]|jgi:predicted dienelactone hydrolase
MLRFVLITGLVTLLSACDGGGSDRSVVLPLELPSIKGTSGVGYDKFTITDSTRDNRQLEVDIWYPVDDIDFLADPAAVYDLGNGIGITSEIAGEVLPVSQKPDRNLIVFSHGSGGLSNQAYSMMEALATQGFIVAAPTHAGNANGDNGDELAVQVANRAADMSFVIDQMLIMSSTSGDRFEGTILPDSVGVTGHSFGGVTTLGMAVGFGDAPADPRVTASMPVAGWFFVPAAPITDGQYKSLAIPTLLLGGTLDTSVPIETNREAFAKVDKSPVYNIEIVGAGHNHFTTSCDIAKAALEFFPSFDELVALVPAAAPLQAIYENTCAPDVFSVDESLRIQNVYGVAFFKTFLQNDESFRDYLTEAYVDQNEPNVTFEEK